MRLLGKRYSKPRAVISNGCEKSMFQLQGEIFPFAFIDLTTRSLTGVYAELGEVFEMTYMIASFLVGRFKLA